MLCCCCANLETPVNEAVLQISTRSYTECIPHITTCKLSVLRPSWKKHRQELVERSIMEVTNKGETLEQAASLFETQDMESQRTNTARGKKRGNKCKIITGVLLLCLLVVILAMAFSLRNSNGTASGELWLKLTSEVNQQLQCPAGFSKPPLILVSLDGFRAGYLKDHSSHLPVINRLRKIGTTTPYMRPAYPTKTFPNHYTLVTGLYPESHGIVDNKMYDVTQNAFFSLKSEEKVNPKWYQGEPVWITASHQKLKTGTFFWPGSDVAINGTFPDFYKLYDKSISFEQRVSTVLEWLSLPEGQRPDFYTLYLDEPDSSGHRYGPASRQVIAALENVDRILGMLMDGLTERDLQNCFNLIIVSDHGMEEATCKKAAYVSTYQANTDGFTVIQGPAARIRPTRLPEDYFTFNYEGLVKNLSCRAPDQPMKPYLKENLPKRMHFANNKRIERGHLYMKPGWQAALNPREIKYCSGGFHGSDNLFTNMQAIFIGYGSGFKNNTVVPPFENIELYNLLCDLLGIRPAPNNGTHGSLNHLLKHPFHQPVHPAPLSHSTPCEASGPTPTDNLQCNCTSQTEAMETEMNRRLLAINSKQRREIFFYKQRRCSALADPHTQAKQNKAKRSYATVWSPALHCPPLTVALSQTRAQPLSPELEACVHADVRIPPAASQRCRRYRDSPALSYGLLHPPYLSADGPKTDSLITSNMAPMFPAFKDVWTHFHDVLLPKYSQQLNGVNVVSGPIFDEDYDGNVDAFKTISGNEAPIPTHFFVILTSCGNSTFSPVTCEGPLQARSFILPHRPDHTESCAEGSDLTWVEDWLQFHTARVRDIELLTGLSFYHNRLSVEETLQLKTFLHTA
uniref:ectonucleotide pyrophosphatase/phosphodiesterase family member 1 n=1 Tax=Monopterus albus TaxID=43700 RepID=UPI0009B32B4A|nr:ectonucleotide pyrophosphatase/phosphodiesterase family member 1-like [Monopterus albus]